VGDVLRVADMPNEALSGVLGRYGFTLRLQDDAEPINGSFWGESEAGIVGQTVYARRDTPIHSLLHETCHLVCMDASRRSRLHTDAGGDDLEEAAVCYLQIVLAEAIDGVGSERLMLDMDAWGYSFRLGSTARWFREDAEDARDWLLERGLLEASLTPSWRVR